MLLPQTSTYVGINVCKRLLVKFLLPLKRLGLSKITLDVCSTYWNSKNISVFQNES